MRGVSMAQQRSGADARTARAALVMAGTKGIGLGCAQALAGAGFAVAVCARTAGDVDATATLLRAGGAHAHGVVVGVRDGESRAAVFESVDGVFGRLYVLVRKAGGPAPRHFLARGDDDW